MTDFASLRLAIESGDVKRATAELDKMTAAGGRAETAAKKLGAGAASAGQQVGYSAFQMQQLGYQLNDFAVQVSSGQSPFTALVQQGSQLSGTFGGVGGALRAVASLITPLRVALGLGAAAVGALGMKYLEGKEQAEELRKGMALTGNAAGVTAGQIDAAARQLAQSTTTGVGTARDVLTQLVTSGKFSGQALTEAGKASILLSQMTGESSDKIVKDLASMTGGVAKWAETANQSYHFLDASQLAYIRSLEEQGRVQEAAAATLEALNGHLGRTPPQLGLIERGLKSAKKEWSDFWDAAAGLGRPETTQDKLAGIQARLNALATRKNTGLPGTSDARAGALRDQQAYQQENLRLENRLAEKQAERAETSRKQIAVDALKTQYMSKEAKQAKELADATALMTAAGTSEADQARVLAGIREKYGTKSVDLGQRLLTDMRERVALLGKESEVERITAEIALGKYGKLSQATRDAVLALAAEADKKREALDLERELAKAKEQFSKQRDKDAMSAASETQKLIEGNNALRDEIAAIGATEIAKAAIEAARVRAARTTKEEQLAVLEMMGATADETATIRDQIQVLKEREQLLGVRGEYREADAASKKVGTEVKDTMSESISQGLLDGFRRGSSFADLFLRELKAQFAKTILTPVIQPIAAAGNALIGQIINGMVGAIGGTSGTTPTTGDFARMDRMDTPSSIGDALSTPQGAGGSVTITYAPVTTVDSRSDQAQVAQIAATVNAEGQKQLVESLRAQGVIR